MTCVHYLLPQLHILLWFNLDDYLSTTQCVMSIRTITQMYLENA